MKLTILLLSISLIKSQSSNGETLQVTTNYVTPATTSTSISRLTNAPNRITCNEQFNKCYIILPDLLTWHAAELQCVAMGRHGHLTSIGGAFENRFIFDFTNETSNNYWVGATRVDLANFTWTDNTTFGYTNWAPTFPTANVNDECVAVYVEPIHLQQYWYNTNCDTFRKLAVCEVDREESCPAGWIHYGFAHACYMVGYSADWEEAKLICETSGGNLASIHSQMENDFIAALATNSTIIDGTSSDMTWIGLQSTAFNSTFAWIDGTDMDFENWAEAEPDNYGGNEYCGQLLTVKSITEHGLDPSTYYWKWNDLTCGSVMRSYVCKRPAR